MYDILIVEDGLHERERLQRLFSEAHYKVSCAERVVEAEQLLERNRYRLVILDIGLEDKSGIHLFGRIKQHRDVPYIIVLTGNPSTHLKQRFLDEGAYAYLVKASPAASNDSLLATVSSLLGTAEIDIPAGIPLVDFVGTYIDEASSELFFDSGKEFPACSGCGSRNYLVTFRQKTQLPPLIEGQVICADCGQAMDPEVG